MPDEFTSSIESAVDFPERIQGACGVDIERNLPRHDEDGHVFRDSEGEPIVEESHQLLLDELKVLGDFEYRSGEDDGAGIKAKGIPFLFYNKKIADGEFLSPTGEVLGHPDL